MTNIGLKKLTYDEVCQIIGANSRGIISKFTHKGIMPRNENGEYDIDACIAGLTMSGRNEYALNLSNYFTKGILPAGKVKIDPKKIGRPKTKIDKNDGLKVKKPIGRPKSAPSQAAIEAIERMNAVRDDYVCDVKELIPYGITRHEADAFLSTAKARMAHREDLLQSKKLVNVEDMAKDIQNMFFIVKSSFMSIPSKAAPHLKKFKEEAEIEHFMKNMISNTLEELSTVTREVMEKKLNISSGDSVQEPL